MVTPHLPLDVSRCTPSVRRCPQADQCARATDWPIGRHIDFPVVDASVCLIPSGWCAMFIDRRGLALQPQGEPA